jgi:hypothetical protein
MTTLALPRRTVKTTRTRRPSPLGLARALHAAYRRLEALIPDFHRHPTKSDARARWLDRTWWPAGEAASRAESALLAHLRRRGDLGMVADGKLFLNLGDALGDISEYRGVGVLVVDLADVPDLETGPGPDDARHWAEQNPDWHTSEPTPLEVLDAPAPFDADELAEAGRRCDDLPLLDPQRTGPMPRPWRPARAAATASAPTGMPWPMRRRPWTVTPAVACWSDSRPGGPARNAGSPALRTGTADGRRRAG